MRPHRLVPTTDVLDLASLASREAGVPATCESSCCRVATVTDLAVRNHCQPRQPTDMGTRLYVGNLSFDATEDSLSEAFSQDSRQVSSVSIMTDRDTGQSRGFAFIEMASEDDAQAAMQAMDGKELDGRTLRVNEAQERKGGGGGGNNRSRGRGGW